MSVRIIIGDCTSALPALAAEGFRAHSAVTDPPYGIGFMGREWDRADNVAFRPETWKAVLDCLLPGAHLLAFGGTRQSHRLMVAIEDAGFEIRDQIGWLYGSGFPKSHDVSKGIDKRPGVLRHSEFAAEMQEKMASKGFTNTFDVAEQVVGRRTGAVANWQKYQFPAAKWWPALRDLLDMDGAKWDAVIAEADRETVGQISGSKLAVAPGQESDRGAVSLDITRASTLKAAQWAGWGTALKPAWEPIVVARKPLIGTVAANVLAHGTGAINIDACRIVSEDKQLAEKYASVRNAPPRANAIYGADSRPRSEGRIEPHEGGRWPANVIHDGSDEVEAAFAAYGETNSKAGGMTSRTGKGLAFGMGTAPRTGHTDSGTASRFFYSAKADSDDRAGSKHPTVKPTDLMRYLVKLVTPIGGTVLDPFAGTGSTGLAADQLSMSAVLIEQSAEYAEDARRKFVDDAGLFADVLT